MKTSFAYAVCLVAIACLCHHAAAPACAAPSVSEQVGELLRLQIETWKTPPSVPEPSLSPTDASVPAAIGEVRDPNSEASPSEPASASAPPAKAPIESSTPKVPPPPLPKLMAANEVLRTAVMLARFYEERAYRPAWSADAEPLPQAQTLLTTIQNEAEQEGLRSSDYRLIKLRKLLQEAQQNSAAQLSPDPRALADLDLLLTDTFLTYGVYVSIGKTSFDALDASWFEKREKNDLVLTLQQALQTNNIENTLKTLPPQHLGYKQLRETLAQYRVIAARGGWPQVAAGLSLRPGEQNERVPQLRERLRVTKDLDSRSHAEEALLAPSSQQKKIRKIRASESLLYDPVLVGAVKKFQRRHSLEADGVVGGETVTVLNVSVDTRIQQIIANMDRWRALPPNLGEQYIVVNIPNFTLDVIAGEETALHMKVVVGKMVEELSTPTFSAQMSYLVLNPYWHVPKSIAEKELFPLSRKDPEYFAKNNFIVQRVEIGQQLEPDPNATDGSMISKKRYQYRLKQAPGPKNALGRIKFIFPNPYGVYLHDTPSKSLFNRTVRTYSHGCIRIEKPLELAEYLLQETSGKWTRDSLLSTIDRQKEKTVRLPTPVPVYIQYWTAWIDAEGEVQFRNDIYGYDKAPGARLPVSAPRPRPQPPPSLQEQPVLQPPLSPTPQSVPPTPSPVETQQPL